LLVFAGEKCFVISKLVPEFNSVSYGHPCSAVLVDMKTAHRHAQVVQQARARARTHTHTHTYTHTRIHKYSHTRTHAHRSGRTWVLISTDLIGRGMDFIGVNTVINYDFPTTTADYIHRIGRTGRAGHTGGNWEADKDQDLIKE